MLGAYNVRGTQTGTMQNESGTMRDGNRTSGVPEGQGLLFESMVGGEQ